MATMPNHGKYGRTPYDPTKFAPRLEQYMVGALRTAKLPPANGDVDRLTKVQTWPMYANDQYGCCVWSMIGHCIQAMSSYANAEVDVPVESLLEGYTTVTGFNSNDPSTDNGTNIQDALNYWRDTGIKDSTGNVHKIAGYAAFGNPRDEVLLAQVLNVFGTVCLGYNLPTSAETQFDNNKPWSYVANSQIAGGHAIACQRRSVGDIGVIKDISWGRAVPVTRSFHTKYVEEAWAVVSYDWLNTQGSSIQGLDLPSLIHDMQYV